MFKLVIKHRNKRLHLQTKIQMDVHIIYNIRKRVVPVINYIYIYIDRQIDRDIYLSQGLSRKSPAIVNMTRMVGMTSM